MSAAPILKAPRMSGNESLREDVREGLEVVRVVRRRARPALYMPR